MPLRSPASALRPRNRPAVGLADLFPGAGPEQVLGFGKPRSAILTALDTLNPAGLRRAIGDRLVYLAKQRGPVPNRPKRHRVYDSRPQTRPATTSQAGIFR